MPGLTSIPGIQVGHFSDFDGLTGCTVILCEQGAVAGVDVCGGATGAEELLVLDPGHIAPVIHGLVLAGGSAFGLEAASGVRRFLEQRKVGFPAGPAKVPIVPCAILFDLALGNPRARPTREMGEAAAAAATSQPEAEGAVGAGVGATIGKALGMRCAMKSGIGAASTEIPSSRVRVAALAAVNAFGDVRHPNTGAIVAGARRSPTSREFLDTHRWLLAGGAPSASFSHTTLIVVATDAALTKASAARLAQMAQAGVARTISPVFTPVDGDLVFALSTSNKQADLITLGAAAAAVVSEAILRAVTLAPTLGGIPGLHPASASATPPPPKP